MRILNRVGFIILFSFSFIDDDLSHERKFVQC